jgi:alanyl-tRNA synthetase
MAPVRTHDIRSRFVDYFTARGHVHLPSGSLVPPDWDTSVLITTAGMQPLKRYFLGVESPPAKRAVTVQKCFRTVDIDQVGKTARHNTFFEMLGNFSFGDYFKEGAIAMAWELSTSPDGFALDPDRIWISVYQGDERVPADEEAVEIWLGTGVPAERIVRLGGDNFWQAGPTGPCGPCSELYYDRGAEHGCGRAECAPGCECDRFMEFWNLVFMQYNMLEGGGLEPLPAPSIDTGAGLERLAAVTEGVYSVYETDAFADIIRDVERWSGASYGGDLEQTKALCVLADHGRSMTFLASDGIEPSNEGRGYVLRRIVRRAIVHARRIGLEQDVTTRLHDKVVSLLGHVYPELLEQRDNVSLVLAAEEERFSRTLDVGGGLLDEVLERSGLEISAEDAFKLHDTYGFPFELTAEIAAEHGKSVDEVGFARLMDQQRERARASTTAVGFTAAELDAGFKTEFVGYELLDVHTQIGALAERPDGLVAIKLRESPFYPAGGGQVADTGVIESATGRAVVEQVIRQDEDQQILARMERGELVAGERVRAKVDAERRRPTMANHTATHLLHAALRRELGEGVTQAGSYVGPDKLRFDFRHDSPLSPEQLDRVTRLVNERIIQNLPVHTFVTERDHARELGAMMLFGEKYGEQVRVVEVDGVSRELCGGTHVRSTAEIGLFVLQRESSSSQGVRRIEAVTAGPAIELMRERAAEADRLEAELASLRSELKKAERGGGGGRAADGNGREAGLLDSAVDRGGIRVVAAVVEELDADGLLQISDRLRARLAPAVVVLGSAADGKVHLIASADQAAVDRGVSAVDVIREIAPIVGGGGGGRPMMARAGGRDPAQLDAAIAAAKTVIRQRLGGGDGDE